ncbi:MAG: mechanosensitive ion channel family protein [Anaerolineales bacterium]|nr:mechanosensitive ion channel family protein [Anaerolineales bacterium]
MVFKVERVEFNIWAWFANLLQWLGLSGTAGKDSVDPFVHLIAVLGILIVLVLLPMIDKLFNQLYRKIEKWSATRLRVIRFQNLEITPPSRIGDFFVGSLKSVRSVVKVILMLTGLGLLLSIFPATRQIVSTVFEQIGVLLGKVWESLVDLLPDMLALLLIAVITRFTLKVLRFLSEGIKEKKIKVSGMHPDLVDPTYQLLRMLVIAFAIVAAFPYIPGSDSPVFRGISIFVGFLLSLGSTSLVSNLIAGLVLIYTRGLGIGDRIEIGDTVGDVVARNLLVTRIRTIKNVVITIPNSMVLSAHIVNYSADKDEQGLILHSTVTIGYDVPWRQVHQLLVAAARATRGIIDLPEPFVLQTSLDDYYVSYEVNAYTREPARMALIYSELHQNIQDKFNEANVEIMSPSYAALRDGNAVTIPPKSVTIDYSNLFRSFADEETRPRPSMGD